MTSNIHEDEKKNLHNISCLYECTCLLFRFRNEKNLPNCEDFIIQWRAFLYLYFKNYFHYYFIHCYLRPAFAYYYVTTYNTYLQSTTTHTHWIELVLLYFGKKWYHGGGFCNANSSIYILLMLLIFKMWRTNFEILISFSWIC